MDVFEAISTRRSIRKYKKEPIARALKNKKLLSSCFAGARTQFPICCAQVIFYEWALGFMRTIGPTGRKERRTLTTVSIITARPDTGRQ